MRSSAVVAGRGFDHDTDRPDIHTASEAYARRFTGGGRVAIVRQAECLDNLLSYMDGGPMRVLDVGGGHAQTTELLLSRGHSMVVHGSAPSCFARLSPIARSYPGRIASCTSALLDLPFADDSFDLVMATRLMAHVTRWRELLAELLRVTRRYLIIDFPVLSGAQRLAGGLFRLKMRVEGNTRPFFLYNRHDVVDHLHLLGAVATAEQGEMVLPMALHRVLANPALSLRAESLMGRVGLRSRWASPVLLLVCKSEAPERDADDDGVLRPAAPVRGHAAMLAPLDAAAPALE